MRCSRVKLEHFVDFKGEITALSNDLVRLGQVAMHSNSPFVQGNMTVNELHQAVAKSEMDISSFMKKCKAFCCVNYSIGKMIVHDE